MSRIGPPKDSLFSEVADITAVPHNVPVRRVYPRGYTPAEHAVALDAILARLGRITCPEPGCRGSLQWEPPHKAEEDTGCRAWRGGVNCDSCGFVREDDPIDEDAIGGAS